MVIMTPPNPASAELVEAVNIGRSEMAIEITIIKSHTTPQSQAPAEPAAPAVRSPLQHQSQLRIQHRDSTLHLARSTKQRPACSASERSQTACDTAICLDKRWMKRKLHVSNAL